MADDDIQEDATSLTDEVEAVEEQAPEEVSGDEKSKTLLSGDEGDGEAEDEAVPEVPEKYEFNAPDGVEIDPAKLEAFGDTAKSLGLTQDQYQKLIEYDIERSAKATQEMSAQYETRISGWADATKADKELGGDKLPENLGLAKRAIETFGSPELARLIDAPSAKNPEGLGLGNHPEVIRLFYRVGKAISESDLVTGDTKVESRDSLQKMYPTMFNNAG